MSDTIEPVEPIKVAETPAVVEPPKPEPPKITDADKEAFFKCFLSDSPFFYDQSLLDGKLVVKFKTLTVEESDDVFRQINLDIKADKAPKDDSYLQTIVQYRLGLSVAEINRQPFAPDFQKDKVAVEGNVTYVSQRAALLKQWPVPKLVAVIDAFNDFEKKTTYLIDQALNADFWKAAE
jgi:hypothetical protein